MEYQLHTCRSVHLTYSRTLSNTVHSGRLRKKLRLDRSIEILSKGKAVQPVVGDITGGMSVTLNIEVVRKKLFGDDE